MSKFNEISNESLKLFESNLLEFLYSDKKLIVEDSNEKDPHIECDKIVTKCTTALNELATHLRSMPSSKAKTVAGKITEMYEFVHKITPSKSKLMDEPTTEEKPGVQTSLNEDTRSSNSKYPNLSAELERVKAQHPKLFKQMGMKSFLQNTYKSYASAYNSRTADRGDGKIAYEIALLTANKMLKKLGLDWDDLPDVNSLWDAVDETTDFDQMVEIVKGLVDERIGDDYELFDEDIKVSANASNPTLDTAFKHADERNQNVVFTESKYPKLKTVLERYNTKYGKRISKKEIFECGKYFRDEKKDGGEFLSEYANYILNLNNTFRLNESKEIATDVNKFVLTVESYNDYIKYLKEIVSTKGARKNPKIIKEVKISTLFTENKEKLSQELFNSDVKYRKIK